MFLGHWRWSVGQRLRSRADLDTDSDPGTWCLLRSWRLSHFFSLHAGLVQLWVSDSESWLTCLWWKPETWSSEESVVDAAAPRRNISITEAFKCSGLGLAEWLFKCGRTTRQEMHFSRACSVQQWFLTAQISREKDQTRRTEKSRAEERQQWGQIV